MIVRTERSTYEIDEKNNRVRRLYGDEEATSRQGSDGEWKHFAHVMGIKVGSPMLFVWDEGTNGIPKATQTSFVTAIDPIADN